MEPKDDYGVGMSDILAMQQRFARIEQWVMEHLERTSTLDEDDRAYFLKSDKLPPSED